MDSKRCVKKDTLFYSRGKQWGPKRPIAAFDFDSTLQKFRKKGPSGEVTRAVLRQLGVYWNVVIFTNRGSAKPSAFTALDKYLGLLEEEGGTCDAFASTAQDRYRKPQVGAWEAFLSYRYPLRNPEPLLLAKSFFCGDAAGRDADFSAADRWFALNIGLTFRVPEQIFGGLTMASPIPRVRKGFETYVAMLKAISEQKDFAWDATAEAVSEFDVVIMVGSPASGKTTFARILITKGFCSVSQDVLGSAKACVAQLKLSLGLGHRVVVDNTHRSKKSRGVYISAVQAVNPEARIALVWIQTSAVLCRHLDGLRCNSDTSGKTKLLPRVAMATYWKQFETPIAEEGGEVIGIGFERRGNSLDLTEKRFMV